MRALIISAAAALCLASLAPAEASPADAGVEAAARAWLSLVDQGDFDASWAQAGDLFHAHLNAHDWAAQVGPARQPLGPALTRKFDEVNETTSLPGALDGRYAIVRFDTAFQHKQAAVETVILAYQAGGWSVDGYFIR